MRLPEQIKKYRKQYGLSQEELADKIYVSRQTISNWENNRSYPDIENLLILSGVFEVSLDNLVKGDLDDMKRELSKYSMDLWTKVMLIFLLLGVIVGIPITYVLGRTGLVIALVLLIIGELAAFKVERIKKRYDLKTYQDIIDFTENREAIPAEKELRRNGYWKQKLFLVFVSMAITAILALLTLMLTRLIVR